MIAAAHPPDEAQRLEILRAHHILDSPPDAAFDAITREAMEVCGAPIGRVSFVDEKRQWFKSRFGSAIRETPRDQSMCAHALLTPEKPLIIPDTIHDPRFADNPAVTGETGCRFYAGFPLRSPEGVALGTLCVLDRVPRQLSADQTERMSALAKQVSLQLSLQRRAPAERRLAAGLALALLLMGGLALFFVRQSQHFLVSDGWVDHINEVIRIVERTEFELQTAESNQRGYSSLGQAIFLGPYENAMAQLTPRLNNVRRAVSDDPAQVRRCEIFAAKIRAKVAIMQERIEQRRTLGGAILDPKYLNGKGRQAMDEVIAAGDEMIAAEKTRLSQRADGRTNALRHTIGLLLGASAVGACLLAAGFVLTRRELRRSHSLGQALAHANLGLESEVAERRRAQQRLGVQHAIAHVAAENTSLAQAAPAFLRCIGERLDWDLGELWTVDPATQTARLADHWHSESGGPDEATRRTEFAAVSQGWTFAKGEGLPGRVWANGTALWECHLHGGQVFLRTAPAQRAGLQRAFAFPLRTDHEGLPTGVMVFLSREAGAPDGELVATMDSLAEQITQFTERCGAEAALRASQRRFTAFIEHAPALAYIKDEAGRMLYGNETLLHTFGLRSEDWLGKTDADFWPEAAPALRAVDQQVLAEDCAVEVQEDVPLPDGRMSHWLSYKFPLRDEATGGRLLAGMSINITAREEAEAHQRAKVEAERANQAKSQFLSRVSHELRTPLNAILGFGQLLQSSPRMEQDTEALEYILKAGRHLLGLVDEVLDLSRAESGEMQLCPSRVEAVEAVRGCVRLVARLAEERGLTCEVRGCEPPLFLWCDEKRLRQILLNLLSNAIKYNREGGRVTVWCEATANGRVSVEVSDTGWGIAPAEMGRLFVPFERLEQTQGQAEGVGLGLVVSRRMAEAMGGSLEVRSVEGEGSTFRLELPYGEEPVAEAMELEVDPEVLAGWGVL